MSVHHELAFYIHILLVVFEHKADVTLGKVLITVYTFLYNTVLV